jgi:hypothetical protein
MSNPRPKEESVVLVLIQVGRRIAQALAVDPTCQPRQNIKDPSSASREAVPRTPHPLPRLAAISFTRTAPSPPPPNPSARTQPPGGDVQLESLLFYLHSLPI